MGRYERLVGNTFVFALGSFSSKFLVFLMLRYYTAMLSPAQFGIADRIATTSNLLMPFVMLSINEAIIRFAMDKTVKRSDVFSIGIKTILLGFIIFCALSPVMLMIDMLAPYTLLIYIYVLVGMLKAVCAQFVRSIGLVRLFAFDGFLSTLTTIALNVLFLTTFSWGLYGYVLSIIASNIISILFLAAVAQLGRYIDFAHPNAALRREMLRYSVPLIPTTMFWWIVNTSDKYMVTWFCGDAQAGMLAIAHKIPGLLTIVSAIFYQAWQISAMDESGRGQHTMHFYSQTYAYYGTLLFCAASGMIMLIQPVTKVMYAPVYYESWQYVPFLVVAEVFSSLVTFLGSFYMVSKRNATAPLAIFIGAAANIVLNLSFIPRYGVMGAAFATLLSYLLAFAVRTLDIKRIYPIEMSPVLTAVRMLLLMVQGSFLIRRQPSGFLVQAVMFLLMVLVSGKSIIRLAAALVERLAAARYNR